jgi:hypothetical protein
MLVFIELLWDTLLLSQAEDRAPLESDPSADLEAGMRWEAPSSRLSLAS